jgi:glutamyl-tRNA reductase
VALAKWQLLVCGISHKSSELSDREPLQIGPDRIAEANSLLGDLPQVRESAIVSTCNRVEFYVVADRSKEAIDIVADFYARFNDSYISGLGQKFYTKKGRHAADHLFRVAAGIDSMVLGENQIVGQLKDAYTSACSVKSAGKLIHRLFHQAFRVGKAVRADTEVGKGACSVSSASVSLLKSRIAELKKPSVLFVGINQMIFLAASNMLKLDCGEFMFANRTPEKAVEFASRFDSTGHSLEELPSLLEKTDIVVTCTSSPQPIISERMILDAASARNGRRLTVMDMAIPRDVEYNAGNRDDIEILDLDDVKKFIERRQEQMVQAIPQAEVIIDQKLSEFTYWYSHVLHEPLYNGLEETFQAIRMEELGPILSQLPPETKSSFDRASRRLVNRLLQIRIRAEDNSSQDKNERMEK